MGMKPRMNEHALPINGVVNNPKPVNEFANIPNTVSTLKKESDKAIPGVVSTKMNPKTL